jgi:hypothetical protein
LLRNLKKQWLDCPKRDDLQGQLAEASKEGLDSERAVVPMMMMMISAAE